MGKFSNSIHNKLDEKGRCKLSVNCIASDDPTTDFYKPAAEADYEDPSAGFCDPAGGCIAPTPTSALQRSNHNKLSRDPAHNKQKSPLQNGALKTFSSTESEVNLFRMTQLSLQNVSGLAI